VGKNNLIIKGLIVVILILLAGSRAISLNNYIDRNFAFSDTIIRIKSYSENDTSEDNPNQSFGPKSWWNDNWSFSERITINHIKVIEDLTNFPVLVSVLSDDLIRARSDGYDFVFVNGTNETVYNHEIEFFNQSLGELIAWVNVTYLSSDEDTILYLYYGNSNCSNQENVIGTWDSDFIGVFHMDQANRSLIDSTNTEHAVDFEDPGPIYHQFGKVGYCVELGGFRGGGYFLMTNDEYMFNNDDATLEAWVNFDENKDSDDTIIYLGRSSLYWPPWPRITLRKLKHSENNGKVIIQCGESDSDNTIAFSDESGFNLIEKWIYTVGVVDYSGDELSLFIDGIKQISSASVLDYNLGLASYNFKSAIGYDGMGQPPDDWNYLDGKIDEIRISKIARSPAWIETSYNAMSHPSSFIIFGKGFFFTINYDGGGIVVKDPDQSIYANGTEVQLTAIPDSGWIFNHWSGNISGFENPTNITVDSNIIITAHFVDVAPPVINNVSASPSLIYQWDNVNISCSVTDNMEVDNVWVTVIFPDNTTSSVNINEGLYYNTTYNKAGIYEYYISSDDINGNSNVSPTYNFTVLHLNPSNQPPNLPISEHPTNNSGYESVYNEQLSVYARDNDGDNLTIFFYWANDTIITEINTTNGTFVSINLTDFINPIWLVHDTEYFWYVIISDYYDETIGPLWSFHTSNSWDINEDGTVDYLDISALSSSYGDVVIPGSIGSDINEDGSIDYLDASSLSSHYGENY